MRKSASILLTASFLLACPRNEVARPDHADVRPPDAASIDEPDPEPTLTPTQRTLQASLEGIEGQGPIIATLKTSAGDLECTLFDTRAPLTVANFVGLSRGTREWRDADGELHTEPLYRNLPFHRIEPGFLVETGDPTGTGRGGPGYVFDDEIDPELLHDGPGVLSMSNHGPNTNGSQFFITLKEAPHLNGRHTILGKCEPESVLEDLAKNGTAATLEHILIARERPTE